MPALSSDPAERGAFFASLADVANRRHEPWVLDGLRALHHPLRADSLREVHRSRAWRCCRRFSGPATSSFRNAGWTPRSAATRSPAAAQTVTGVRRRAAGGYPDRLRRIILSSADDLFRSARMK